MKSVLFFLGMMSILSTNDSFAFGRAHSSSDTPTDNGTPVVVDPPVNSDTGTGGLSVVIHETTNFNATMLAKLEVARGILQNVVNSEEFKQKVIHFTYQGQETYVQNNGLTNLQIYNLIREGAEKLPVQTAADHVMDIFAELYTSNWFGRNTIGYTNPAVHTIFMNTYFYNTATPDGIAGNIMHEWMHKIGFDHDSNSTARRPSSVPYAVGYIAEEMASHY